jgi:glycine oxidase
MNYNFIVVGHGLAGAIIADTLRASGYKVLVIDEPKRNSASHVAAGLVNPIAGKRFAKSWFADSLLPAANNYYGSLGARFGEALYIHKPIYKIFSSIEEQNTWMAKSAEEGWGDYIEHTYTQSTAQPNVQDPFGGIMIKQGGYLKVSKMLDHLTEELIQDSCMLQERFNYDNLILTAEGVTYKTITAQKIIFCEGYQVQNNPYFKWLPLVPTKGEVLEVQTENFTPECIYNKGVYVVPIDNNRFKIGATYDWRQPDEKLTEQAGEELATRFKQITSQEFHVINHEAGIRPAVRDRKPLVGQHPEYNQLYVFNGMGSKGVLMAPFFARQFVAYLDGTDKILQEVNISRYLSLYYNYIKHF